MSDAMLAYDLVELEPGTEPEPRKRPGPFRVVVQAARWLGRAVASASDWVFGAVALTVGLSVLAATPVAQFLAFGYLLEAGGRVARTGRLRDGLVGVRKASRAGSVVVGVWLFLLPLQLASSLATSAQLVDPGGQSARRWKIGLVVLTALVALHVVAACARGGRVRHFLLPFGNPIWIVRRLRQGGAYASARDAVWGFVAGLRLPYYFRLGLLGFAGTMAWLALPVSLIAAGRRAPILVLPGALLLGLVALPLPFLQARYAAEDRFGALFDVRGVRDRFARAPWAFATALALTLTAAVPLYLLKIEMIPRETVWLPSLVFLAFMYPARVLTGWAYGRSSRRERPRHGFVRWTGRLAMIPVVAVYVLIVFLSQYTAWRGVWSLYEQHAFLLPVPFLGI
jgi:hypothetical protein